MYYTGDMKRVASRKTIGIVVGAVAAAIVIIGVAIFLIFRWLVPTYSVKICTSIDYDYSPVACDSYKTVEIVRGTEDDPQLCEDREKEIYEVVGGFVGLRYIGCEP